VHESRLYRCADRLILHSEYSRDIFLTHHSEAKSRVVVSPHGLYTMFQSSPNARSRVRNALGIGDGTVVFLFCGAIRPYKNVDAVIAALKDPKCKDAIVVIAGRESHYPDSDPSDPLGRCRRLAIEHGVAERLRFVPAHLDIQAISDLFEAGDAVLLPYIESYGSGMLLMGMTFGKFVLTTAVGGAGEYLKDYTSRCIISGPGTGEVLAGMADVIGRVKAAPCPSKVVAPGRLLWANISRALIDDLKALVRPSRKCVRRQNEP
jgi:glycosyltransferase involved in cell wall biosynthesis